MEKNVIIAFVLSLLVIVAFSSLQQPARPPGPVTTAESPERGEPAAEPPVSVRPEPSFPVNDAAGDEPPPEIVSAEIIVVETDLYRAEFDSLGARLVSFGLRHYTREDEEFLETLSGKRHAPFEIAGYRNVVFRADRSGLSLTADGETGGTITFAGEHEGRTMVKRFSFDNARYGIGFTLEEGGAAGEGRAYLDLAAFTQEAVPRDRHQVEEIWAADAGEKPLRFRAGQLRDTRRRFENAVFLTRRSQYTVTFVKPEEPLPALLSGDEAGNVSAFYLLAPEQAAGRSFYFYSGPADHAFLEREKVGIARLMPAGPMVVMSRTVLRVLTVFHRAIPNWGVAIILLTILFKLAFFPLTRIGLRSMKTMQKIQPMLKELSKKYKDNPQAMQKEMFGIYRQYGVNPMSSCLPMLLQIPIFIAIFVMLRSAIVLRGASFTLWIRDLSMPDRLFTLNEFPVNILPLLMGGTMFLQQKLSGGAAAGGMGRQQQQMMLFMMPIMLTVFLYNLPSGLMLYWTTTNLISIIEHRLSTRHLK